MKCLMSADAAICGMQGLGVWLGRLHGHACPRAGTRTLHDGQRAPHVKSVCCQRSAAKLSEVCRASFSAWSRAPLKDMRTPDKKNAVLFCLA